eukprot:scaffold663_cov341-Pavlova_lutheri.AAC.7
MCGPEFEAQEEHWSSTTMFIVLVSPFNTNDARGMRCLWQRSNQFVVAKQSVFVSNNNKKEIEDCKELGASLCPEA